MIIKTHLLLILIFTLLLAGKASCNNANWSEWNTPNDTASNGIDLSYKADCATSTNGECKYVLRWNNRYDSRVELNFRIKYSTQAGIKSNEGKFILEKGVNEIHDTVITGISIESVQIGVSPKGLRLVSTKPIVNYVKLNNDENDERDARSKLEEKARWERSVSEFNRNKNGVGTASSNSSNYRRQQESENQNLSDALISGLQNMQNSLNQGAAAMNYANQVNADVDAQLRRKKEAREREARELQRQRNEDAARQQREAENRRVERQREQERIDRVAQEQQARAELERLAKEAERKALAAQAAKEQLAREQQKKEQLAQNNASQYTLGTSGSYATYGTFKPGSSGIPGGTTGGSKGPSGASGSGSPSGSSNSGGSSGSSTGSLSYCPPDVWDEMSSDGKRFYVYVLNTCPTERLQISSVNYWGHENVTCGTMAMPDLFFAGAKASPLDCRKFGFDSDQAVYPKYKVIWKIIP